MEGTEWHSERGSMNLSGLNLLQRRDALTFTRVARIKNMGLFREEVHKLETEALLETSRIVDVEQKDSKQENTEQKDTEPKKADAIEQKDTEQKDTKQKDTKQQGADDGDSDDSSDIEEPTNNGTSWIMKAFVHLSWANRFGDIFEKANISAPISVIDKDFDFTNQMIAEGKIARYGSGDPVPTLDLLAINEEGKASSA